MSHARPRLASAPFFFFSSSSFIDLVLSHFVSRSAQPPRNNTQESRNCTGCARIIAVARSPAFAFRLFTVLAASQHRAGVCGSGSSRYHHAQLPARSTGDQAHRRHAKKPQLRRVHAPALLLGSDPSRGISVFSPSVHSDTSDERCITGSEVADGLRNVDLGAPMMLTLRTSSIEAVDR